MSEETECEALRKSLAEKDGILQALKEKTKVYIQKLQHDHNEALENEKAIAKAAQVCFIKCLQL
jgi:hypothetical protein